MNFPAFIWIFWLQRWWQSNFFKWLTIKIKLWTVWNRTGHVRLSCLGLLPPCGIEAVVGLSIIPTDTVQCLNWCKCKYWPAIWSTNKENGPGGCAPLWHTHCDYYSDVTFKFDLHQMGVQKCKKSAHCSKDPSLQNVIICETSSLPVLVKDNIKKRIFYIYNFVASQFQETDFQSFSNVFCSTTVWGKWLSISHLLNMFLELNLEI